MGSSVRVVAALLFGSGFAALVYQTAWQRMFRLTFGASTAASAAVLAIFLGGLGLGGLLLGKRVERSPRPLLFYSNLELGISALALLSPLLLEVVHGAYIRLGGSQTLGMPVATALRLLLATLVIGPAAVLMGGTLPAVARAVVSDSDAGRRGLALLYSLNTIGAVGGALVGPLFLFSLLGTKLTLVGAACINLLVALLARLLGKASAPLAAPPALTTAESTEREPLAIEEWTKRVAYAVAGLVGFAFLALELVWFRMLAPLLGGSSLTFGLILACALTGIGIGGYVFSLRPAKKPATLGLLAITLGLEAVCVLIAFAWGDGLALIAAHLRPMANLGTGPLLAGWTFIACVVVLPAAIVSGYQFPALFALLGRGRSKVGIEVGRAYAFNTLGTLLGSLLTGFVLLPSVGAPILWRWLALLLAVAGLACACLALRSGDKRSLLPAATLALLAFLLGAAPGPSSFFRHSPIGAGRIDFSKHTRNEVEAAVRERVASVVWERDGVESTIGIVEDDGFAFVVNGKSDGSVVGDSDTQAMSGLLTAALHGGVESGFVVGLGTGMTAGLLAKVPGVQRVDVAELEPAVLEVARRAGPVNGRALENPKLTVLRGDARELLLTSRQLYDVIVSEPSNPYRVGISSLFTREFYQAVASRLKRRGLFAQWLQGYDIDAPAVSTAITTLRSVFPYVSLWGPGGNDLLLVAGAEPPRIDVERLARDLKQPIYLEWMRRTWSTEGVEGFVARHLAPPSAVKLLTEGLPAPVNTDDLNHLEAVFTRSLGDGSYRFLPDLFATLPPEAHRPELSAPIDWDLVEELRHRVDWPDYRGSRPITKRARAVRAGCGGDWPKAIKLWPPEAEPRDMVEHWVRGMIAASQAEGGTTRFAETLAQAGFVAEALLIRARLAEAEKDSETATNLVIAALDELRKTALPLCDTNLRAIVVATSLAPRVPTRARDLYDALARGSFAIQKDELNRQIAVSKLGASFGDPALCVKALGKFREHPPWNLGALALRAQCLADTAAPDAAAAREDWLEFRAQQSPTFQHAVGAPDVPDSNDDKLSSDQPASDP